MFAAVFALQNDVEKSAGWTRVETFRFLERIVTDFRATLQQSTIHHWSIADM
jgi:hypothetical protein